MRFWKRLLGLTLIFVLGVVALMGAGSTGGEEYAIYSAYIASEFDVPPSETVPIARETSLPAATWFGRLLMLPFCMNTPQWDDPRPRLLVCQMLASNLWSHSLDRRFQLPAAYELVDPELTDSEYLSLSSIGFSWDGTMALFYVEYLRCGLCGYGEYVLMKKIDGRWTIADLHGTWVS